MHHWIDNREGPFEGFDSILGLAQTNAPVSSEDSSLPNQNVRQADSVCGEARIGMRLHQPNRFVNCFPRLLQSPPLLISLGRYPIEHPELHLPIESAGQNAPAPTDIESVAGLAAL